MWDEASKRLGIEENPDKDSGRPTYPPDDGTCLPTSIKQNWENDKQKYAKEKAKKETEKAI